MFRRREFFAALALLCLATSSYAQFNLGRAATPAEISAWHIDVRPDGHGVKPGHGTVAQGQDIFDAKCASCHGTFGESNSYIVIAGGVDPEDLKTGHARRLKDADVVRTVGNKLNYATTLWDYINRAMPWTQPQSLSVNEVYAVTAYVLNLNNIVDADFELNEHNLLTLQMPNRNGMTTAHGMGSVKGKPDVQGVLCMKACRSTVRIISELPAYARGAHGELAQQFRSWGPFGVVNSGVVNSDTPAQTPVQGRPVARTEPVNDAADVAQALLRKHGCVACHAVQARLVGPGLREVAAKYAGVSDAVAQIAQHIREGGVGRWGQVPMPPQANVPTQDVQDIARWISVGAP